MNQHKLPSCRSVHRRNRCNKNVTNTPDESLVENCKIRKSSELFSCVLNTLESYTCSICRYKTDFIVDFKEHSKKRLHSSCVESFSSYNCKKCNFATHSQLVLLKHVTCDECETKKKAKNPVAATPSASSNNNEPNDQCPLCPYKNDSKLFLNMHILAEHNNYESNSSQQNLLVSVNSEENSSQTKSALFKCDYCSYECGDMRDLQRHSIKKHTKINLSERLSCNRCSFITQWKNKLDDHKKIKHGSSERGPWYYCKHCTYKTRELESLRKHFRRKCLQLENCKLYHCDKCSYQTFAEESFKAHVTTHDQITWYKCGKCSYKSKWRSGLEVHKLKHKMSPQERRAFKKRLGMYECAFCPYMTRYRLYFNNHVCNEDKSSAVVEV